MSKPTEPRLSHGWFRFEDWAAPDPHDEKLGEAMHAARYDIARLTQDQAYRILAAAEAYQHYAGHPAATASILRQLRRLRRAVREHVAAGAGERSS